MKEASVIRRWREDPVAFVRECIGTEPQAWQVEVLRAFPKHPRLAMIACKGPGKTACLAWLILNFLATRPHPKIACTSISGDNLGDGLWTELAKWIGASPILKAAFVWQKTRIVSREHPETWWASARQWPKSGDPSQQADTLAGLHADYMLFVCDEAGGVPDGVMAAAEAGLANVTDDGLHEAHIVIAGNPTHLSGPLYRAATAERKLWHVTNITGDPDDPKRSPRVSVEWARQQIEKYGRDNPWVLVNVFGQFPPSSINALLGIADVEAAMARSARPGTFEHAAMILGVDVAREGDDASVIVRRQGIAMWQPVIMRNVTSLHGAGAVAQAMDGLDGRGKADACFVDNTGGFGGGWIDQLAHLRHDAIGVHYSEAASSKRYANKRAEMWYSMAEWVKNGGCLPNCPELVAELTEPTYSFKGDSIIIEPKDDVKARIGRSPDIADALALTFAHPVAPRQDDELFLLRNAVRRNRGNGDWNPFVRKR